MAHGGTTDGSNGERKVVGFRTYFGGRPPMPLAWRNKSCQHFLPMYGASKAWLPLLHKAWGSSGNFLWMEEKSIHVPVTVG